MARQRHRPRPDPPTASTPSRQPPPPVAFQPASPSPPFPRPCAGVLRLAMRLFACFNRSNTIDSPPRHSSDLSSERNAHTSKPHDNFVPTSIPELHPEYAHAEPYRFTARTQSARLLVEKQREAQALSMSPRRPTPVEEQAVVVRGPTYSAKKIAAVHSISPVTPAAAKPPRPVSLKVESPTTADENYVDSDDTSGHYDENADVNRSRPSPRSASRKPSTSSTAMSPPRPKSKSRSKSKKGRKSSVAESKSNSFRIRSKSTKSFKHSKRRTPTHRRNNSDPSGSVSDIAASESISRLPGSTTNSTLPSPPGSEFESQHDTSFIADHIKPHLDNTPAELLEPIRVPRMSAAFQSKRSGSPVISTDSWGPQDSSSQRRYEDVEGDSSSGLISGPPVGKQAVVHKANYPSRAPELPSYAPPSPLHTSSPSVSNRVRSKRKSKPYVLTNPDSDQVLPFEESVPPPELPIDQFPLSKSRRSMMSNDPAPTREIPRIVQAAARDRIRSDESFPPPALQRAQAGNQPQSIMRRASSGKRKTVSFHAAAPTIIEPSPRAPSYSVPRDAVLSREEVRPEVPARLAPALRKTRDSIRFASSSLPRTFDSRDDLSLKYEEDLNAQDSMIRSHSARTFTAKESAASQGFARPEAVQTGAPRTSYTTKRTSNSATLVEDSSAPNDRSMSDFSAGSDESFIARASRRMSTRVVKDREELREASKRQSRAVAAAMASQIRGVPKSAMLAFSENDVVLADSFEEDDDSSSRISLRRKSRQVKSVQLPSIESGVVPKPPPPPPFAPARSRVKSVRVPPPPPVSPLPY
eukprot:TRINITY_DN4102_c0_g1_i1.p1 TRINITY_DN4102_c0_g1~~TRINITY_DN4102_c0_g1_i1.p1  ORF type:complete len:810 (-),score=121.46 TRINITY_DN4102_c0_g1_i1:1036-3465(-)